MKIENVTERLKLLVDLYHNIKNNKLHIYEIMK